MNAYRDRTCVEILKKQCEDVRITAGSNDLGRRLLRRRLQRRKKEAERVLKENEKLHSSLRAIARKPSFSLSLVGVTVRKPGRIICPSCQALTRDTDAQIDLLLSLLRQSQKQGDTLPPVATPSGSYLPEFFLAEGHHGVDSPLQKAEPELQGSTQDTASLAGTPLSLDWRRSWRDDDREELPSQQSSFSPIKRSVERRRTRIDLLSYPDAHSTSLWKAAGGESATEEYVEVLDFRRSMPMESYSVSPMHSRRQETNLQQQPVTALHLNSYTPVYRHDLHSAPAAIAPRASRSPESPKPHRRATGSLAWTQLQSTTCDTTVLDTDDTFSSGDRCRHRLGQLSSDEEEVWFRIKKRIQRLRFHCSHLSENYFTPAM